MSRQATISILLRALANCAIISTWCIYFFLHPLQQDAIRMHEQQLDPTEIVLIPYPIQRLCIYVLANVCATLVVQQQQPSSSSTRMLLDIGQLSGIVMLLCILCGASPYQNLFHTYMASVYLVTCALFHYPTILPTTGSSDVDDDKDDDDIKNSQNTDSTIIRLQFLFDTIQQQLRGKSVGIVVKSQQQHPYHSSSSSSSTTITNSTLMLVVLHQSIAYSCIITTILFQILLLYDNGYQIQRYPIPMILGCTIGYIIGTCIGTIRIIRLIVR